MTHWGEIFRLGGMTSIANTWPGLPSFMSKRPIPPGKRTDRLPAVSSRLTLLILGIVLPLLAFAAFMIVRYAALDYERYGQQLQSTTHATSNAIDAELSRALAILKTLSNSRSLANRQWSAFYDLAKASIESQPGARIVLYDPSGQVVVATLVPYGAPLPKTGDPRAVQRVVETAQPYVSNLFVGAISNQMAVATYQPVIKDGVVTHVLGMVLPTSFIAQVLQAQLLPEGGFGVVIDREGIIISRTRGEDQFRGHLAAPGFLAAAQNADEGSYDTISVEGIPIRAAFTKSDLSGWTTSLGSNTAVLDAPLRNSLWLFWEGGSLLLFVAAVFCLYYGRDFVRSMTALRDMAQSLDRKGQLAPRQFGPLEPQIVANQLCAAAETLNRQAAEREALVATLEQRVLERTQQLRDSTAKAEHLASYVRSLLEASLDPLVTISPEGKITDVNKATELATELPRHLLIGTEFAEYFTDCEKAREGYRQVLAAGFVTDYPLVLRGASGALIDVLCNASVYRNEGGDIVGIFAAARDVTWHRQAEAEIRRYQEELEEQVKERTARLTETNRELEATNKELEAFSYSVSHDLRTPLRAIDGFSRMLLAEHASTLDQEGHRLLNVVRDNTLKMSQLIDDILAFSRIGRATFSPVEVDMEAIARAAYNDLEPARAGRSIEFRLGPLPKSHADPIMMERVFTNLLDNAIKYSAPTANPIIEVEGRVENNEAVYIVRDNGVGFDMRFVGKLFGVFQRLHRPSEFSGTGIGLSIVKRIVARHGGRVWAEGKLNHGTTLGFSLPRAEAANV
jgi:PAS domain S-box-containing protein